VTWLSGTVDCEKEMLWMRRRRQVGGFVQVWNVGGFMSTSVLRHELGGSLPQMRLGLTLNVASLLSDTNIASLFHSSRHIIEWRLSPHRP
jgi:hypothetical protein